MITRVDLYQYPGDLVDGWQSSEIAGIDLDASARRYMQMLAASIRREYPRAVVDWQFTDLTPSHPVVITSDTNYTEQTDAEGEISELASDIYIGQAWLVTA